MFVTPALAQGGGMLGGDNIMVQLLPFVMIFVIMYFLILRPQQKKVKQHQEMVKNVRRGDTVVTSGGLVGRVTKVVDDDQIEVEIAEGVRVRQMRALVVGIVLTHAHFDHIMGVNGLRNETRAPLLVGAAEAPVPRG